MRHGDPPGALTVFAAVLAAAGLLALSAPAQVAAKQMDMPGMAMPEKKPTTKKRVAKPEPAIAKATAETPVAAPEHHHTPGMMMPLPPEAPFGTVSAMSEMREQQAMPMDHAEMAMGEHAGHMAMTGRARSLSDDARILGHGVAAGHVRTHGAARHRAAIGR